MSLRSRVHVKGGFYYASRRCVEGKRLFSTEEDYSHFAKFLAAKIEQLRMRVHAYCWLPTEIHLLVEVDEAPVFKLMQAIGNHFARRLRPSSKASLFPDRYRSVLIDPETYLLKAVRYIHWLSVGPGLTQTLNGYEHSSHLSYLGMAHQRWLTTFAALSTFNQHTELARPGYTEFMQVRPSEEEAQLFRRGWRGEPRVLGSPLFCCKVGLAHATHRAATLEAFAESCAIRMGCKLEDVRSKSRRRELSRVRAVIAWYATKRKIVTLAEVSRYLGDRKPPSVFSAIKYYRAKEPRLFDWASLPCSGPIVPSSVVNSMLEQSTRAMIEDNQLAVPAPEIVNVERSRRAMLNDAA